MLMQIESWIVKCLIFLIFLLHTWGVRWLKLYMVFLEEWGIEQKIFSLTLDNVSLNDKMQDYLRNFFFLHALFSKWWWIFHIRCCAHILNLIVQEELKVIVPAVNKIRESIKYVKGLEGRMQVFKACVAKVGGIHTKMGLRGKIVVINCEGERG